MDRKLNVLEDVGEARKALPQSQLQSQLPQPSAKKMKRLLEEDSGDQNDTMPTLAKKLRSNNVPPASVASSSHVLGASEVSVKAGVRSQHGARPTNTVTVPGAMASAATVAGGPNRGRSSASVLQVTNRGGFTAGESARPANIVTGPGAMASAATVLGGRNRGRSSASVLQVTNRGGFPAGESGVTKKRTASVSTASSTIPKAARPANTVTGPGAMASAATVAGGPNRGRSSASVLQVTNRGGFPAGESGVTKKRTASVSTASSTIPKAAPAKKRPVWDLRGQRSDMEGTMKGYLSCQQSLEVHNTELQEKIDVKERQTSAASSQIKELETDFQTVNEELKRTQSELQECQDENSNNERAKERCESDMECARAQAREQGKLVSEQQASKLTLTTIIDTNECKLKASQEELANESRCAEELQALVTTLRDDTAEKEEELHRKAVERRWSHNTVQELKGNIRVFCRVRPLLDAETDKCKDTSHIQFTANDKKAIILAKMEDSHTGRDRKVELKYDFSFDHVFDPKARQSEVFEEITQLVQSALDGYNVCIFAYGQTGSGKTYTMEGPDDITADTNGMIPRAVNQIFLSAAKMESMGWTYNFTASFLEIYNESLRDLLVARPEKNTEYEIKLVNSTSEQLHVTNLKYVPVSTEAEVNKLLNVAKANRSVAKTAANDRSSRSHSVFQLQIQGRHSQRDLQCTSILSLVDLAGSERLDKSQSKGDRLREAQAINTSLSCLGHVITSLSNKDSHIPYRNSKLTYLLQSSLGGNSKTLMFVNISPLDENFSESLNSLRFASKVNQCIIGTAQANCK